MEVVHLYNAHAQAVVHPLRGGRLGSLTVNGTPVMVHTGDSALDWGCYPMVPFAGRVRNGLLTFREASHSLPANDPSGLGHAIHGTVFDVEWTVVSATSTRIHMTHEFGAPWPWRGVVHHQMELHDASLTCTLTVDAHDDMPLMIGWHPWFMRPVESVLPFQTMLERGADYLPTGKHVVARTEHADDCFVDPQGPITLRYDNVTLTLHSDCSHWVVYSQPTHAICVEPQSGPPNEVNDAPHIVRAGASMQREFTISW